MSADFTPNKEDIKVLPPFKMQVLTNFPYIEADFDALTNYQLLCKVVEYLNMVIHNENEVTTEVENLYNAYVALQNYVNNYFDNLNVQEEINNKLDEMAESGELADIIGQYLQLAGLLIYNTINDLKSADNVAVGSICKTLGFNSINDGGSSYYKIREIINTDVIDEKKLIAITGSETLVAEFMNIDKRVNPFQFGAYGDGDHDDTEVLQYTIDYADDNKLEIYLPTPEEYYKITDALTVGDGVAGIVAEKYDYTGIIRPTGTGYTVLTLNVGVGFYMKNVTIGSEDLIADNGILFTGDVGLTNFENIRVYNLNGYGFKINKIWDSVLTNISIEKCGNASEYAFSFNGVDDTCNMTVVNKLQVEQSNTKAIFIDQNTLSCVFNDIHSERTTVVDGTYAWVLSGNNCTYNNARLTVSNDVDSKKVCGYIESYNSSYNDILAEQYIDIICEAGNGNNCNLSNCVLDYFEEKINQTGLIKLNNCNINEILVRTNTEIDSCKINKVVHEWTSSTDYSRIFKSKITTVDKTSTDARYYIVDSVIGTLASDSVKDMFLSNCTIGALTNNKISYSTGKYINCIFNTTTNLDNATVRFIDSNINGDLSLISGTNPYSFINTLVSGTVGATFGAIPTTAPAKGTRTDNLIPTTGEPVGWVYDGSSWLSYGTLS